MATEVAVPNLGYTMTVAKIIRWFKSAGDAVQAGEPLLEIETDKVNYTIEAPDNGVVKAILAKEGVEMPVGGLIAVIGTREEVIEDRFYREETLDNDIREKKTEAGVREAYPPAGGAKVDRVLASPLARKMAKAKGVDLSLIQGSGRAGRIRRVDVERYINESKQMIVEERPSVSPVAPAGSLEVADVIQMTSMRRTIAHRLSQSSREVPHVYLWTEVDMTEAGRLMRSLRGSPDAAGEIKVTITDIFIKAVAVVLRDHPRLNARLKDNRIEILKDVNIGLAVALEDGLIVPALEKADQKRLPKIAGERKDLVDRAHEGRLTLEEIERGTFTISNLGMYDITFFTSILNPPQSAILSVGKTMERPVVRDGSVVIRPILEMSLAIDHRSVDGALGAVFLQDLKKSLENPYLLI